MMMTSGSVKAEPVFTEIGRRISFIASLPNAAKITGNS